MPDDIGSSTFRRIDVREETFACVWVGHAHVCVMSQSRLSTWTSHRLQSNSYLAHTQNHLHWLSLFMWAGSNTKSRFSLHQSIIFLLLLTMRADLCAVDLGTTPPPPPTKPILHFMSPSHRYLHICQHPLYGQEAATLLWCVTGKVCERGNRNKQQNMRFQRKRKSHYMSKDRGDVIVLNV